MSRLIEEYHHCEDKIRVIAEIVVITQRVEIVFFQIWFNLKRRETEKVIKELQSLKIISPFKNGKYEIIANLEDVEQLFKKIDFDEKIEQHSFFDKS